MGLNVTIKLLCRVWVSIFATPPSLAELAMLNSCTVSTWRLLDSKEVSGLDLLLSRSWRAGTKLSFNNVNYRYDVKRTPKTPIPGRCGLNNQQTKS
jgi:hypothetical protein